MTSITARLDRHRFGGRCDELWSLLAVVVVAFMVMACHAPQFGSENETTESGILSTMVTNRDWPSLHTNPHQVVGRRVDLRARVYAPPIVDAEGTVFCAWVDFDNDQLPAQFRVSSLVPDLVGNEFIWVVGSVTRVTTSDDWCSPDALLQIDVDRLLVTDRLGARPAVVVVPVDQTLEQHGVRVTLDRVEFAAEELRVFVTIENPRNEMFTAFATGLRIEIGTVEIPATVPIGVGIEAPRGRVRPKTVERGGFQFPPLDPNSPPFTVRWQGAAAESIAGQFADWVWIVDPGGVVQPEG